MAAGPSGWTLDSWMLGHGAFVPRDKCAPSQLRTPTVAQWLPYGVGQALFARKSLLAPNGSPNNSPWKSHKYSRSPNGWKFVTMRRERGGPGSTDRVGL